MFESKYCSYHSLNRKEAFQAASTTDCPYCEIDRLTAQIGELNAEVERQKRQPIRVVMGNPPYSVGQGNANENNQNQKYPKLDARIQATYAAQSSATLKNSLYATEIKALRWASDRIGDEGVVGFVTNNKLINGNTADGLRKCLTREFSHVYVFDLRGAVRGRIGDEAKREGQSIFEIMTGIALIVLVKNLKHSGPCELLYHDIGDYLSRDEKLDIVKKMKWMVLKFGIFINQGGLKK